MKVPLRIYYDKHSGEPIQLTGNFEDHWLSEYETVDEQIPKYISLSERNRETFDVIELPYGAYTQDFAESNGHRVNPETKKLEFSYPDPNDPDAPQVFQKALSEQIADVRLEMARGNSELFETMIMLTGGGF